MLAPRSVAVIGATEGTSYGGRMVDNLRNFGFSGKIFPVNPKRSEVKGIPCYASVLDIEEPVDVAALIIPARFVLDALRQCREKGIQSVVIISGGFSERGGQANIDRQKQLTRFAEDNGIYICDHVLTNRPMKVVNHPCIPKVFRFHAG
jgi:acetyltransferase